MFPSRKAIKAGTVTAAAVAGLLQMAPASAQQAGEGPPVIIRPQAQETRWSDRINVAFGVAATSNYISSGVTQSDDAPALQGYGEISSGIFYSGAWLSSVKLGEDRIEIDLYAGVRGKAGPVQLDLAYYRYLYDESGDCCGQWVGKADIALSEKLTLNTQLEIDPQAVETIGTLGATLKINDKWEGSLALEQNYDTGFSNWNAGLTYSMTDKLAMDIRYYGSELGNDRLVATLAWDFSTAE